MNLGLRLVYGSRARAFDLLLHPSVVPWRACAAFAASIVLRPFLLSTSLWLLCRSHSILLLEGPTRRFSLWLHGKIEQSLARACATGGLVEAVVAKRAELREINFRAAGRAGIVLKIPRCEGDRVVERGVLLLKNTECLDSFRRCSSMDRVLEHYSLVLEPSWSGYANPMLLAFCVFENHPIVVMSPCEADHRFLERLGSNLRPIAVGASDWVDPRVFRPLPGQAKRFDVVLVSRWALAKRHHLLLRALRRIGDSSFRVALVAYNIPSDTDGPAIKAMIDGSGLAHQIELFEGLKPEGVNEILNQSKVNLLLSRQEGSNRSLFEGFFAGVPGLAFSNHVGIPRTHFNAQTGRLIAERDLPDALAHFRVHWSEFDPRPWALANITPEITTAKLNLVLRQLAQQRGEPWTRDIVAKCNRPELLYYPEQSADAFPTMADLLTCFPRAPSRV